MKRTAFVTSQGKRYGLVALVSLLVIISCRTVKTRHPESDCAEKPEQSNSLNIALIGPTTDAEIKNAFGALIQNTPVLRTTLSLDSIKIKRCPCDSTLINIDLPNGFIFEGHDGAVRVRPTTQPEGGAIDLTDFGTVAVNIAVATFDTDNYGIQRDRLPNKEEQSQLRYQFNAATSTGKSLTMAAVKIAIFDSGFDPANFALDNGWKTNTTLCGSGTTPDVSSDHGWSFLSNTVTDNTMDSVDIQHGSRVAFLAVQQFANSPVPVKIIPMKVLNKDNKGDLFSILCALETARKNKVDIINMSLGYYGERNALFEKYINRSTDENIWIVVAAGNQQSVNSDRNLSTMGTTFYPAAFSKTNKRVLAVTTVNTNTRQTCLRQNYDSTFVVGVKQDTLCRFRLTQNTDKLLIFGTSYASPILAGWLGRSIRESPLPLPGQYPPGFYPRRAIVNRMNKSGVVGLFEGRTITRK